MRNWAIKCLRTIGVETGGSNVQFAVNPENGRMIIIEGAKTFKLKFGHRGINHQGLWI